jgi:FkbM family methyltransferase
MWSHKMGLKRGIRGALNAIGYDVHRFLASESSWAQLSRLLASHGIDYVVDVGANVGQYAQQLRFLKYQGDILSFEPMESAHIALGRAANSDPRWQVAPRFCIGDHDGYTVLHVSANSESNSVLDVLRASTDVAPGSRHVRFEEVEITTLDTFFRQHELPAAAVPFLKLDVQGFEQQVLAGARGTLPRFLGIQCELSLVPLYSGQLLLVEMLTFLRELGFELHAMLPGFTDERTGRSLQMDGIFFRANDGSLPIERRDSTYVGLT